MRLSTQGTIVLVLLTGLVLVQTTSRQRSMPLRLSLPEVLPVGLLGFVGDDQIVPEAEREVAGMSDYLMRVYSPPASAAAFSLYVGYYEEQTQGRTIHSPKNCLPGAGWEPLSSSRERISTPNGAVEVNRYLLQKGSRQALVLYWYQGRGRIAANEYVVKWNLLRDRAVYGRSDEALVRVVVPIDGDQEEAFRLAAAIASETMPRVAMALPI